MNSGRILCQNPSHSAIGICVKNVEGLAFPNYYLRILTDDQRHEDQSKYQQAQAISYQHIAKEANLLHKQARHLLVRLSRSIK
jgi:hypothetical protein